MGLLLTLLPIAMVVLVGGGIALWALMEEDRPEEPAQASRSVDQLAARPLVLFEPTAWSKDLRRMPVEDLVARLEMDLVQRRREAVELLSSMPQERTDPS